jgi:hypothetical protein
VSYPYDLGQVTQPLIVVCDVERVTSVSELWGTSVRSCIGKCSVCHMRHLCPLAGLFAEVVSCFSSSCYRQANKYSQLLTDDISRRRHSKRASDKGFHKLILWGPIWKEPWFRLQHSPCGLITPALCLIPCRPLSVCLELCRIRF